MEHEATGQCLAVDGESLSLAMAECEVCWAGRVRGILNLIFTIREGNRNSFGNSENKAERSSLSSKKENVDIN